MQRSFKHCQGKVQSLVLPNTAQSITSLQQKIILNPPSYQCVNPLEPFSMSEAQRTLMYPDKAEFSPDLTLEN